MKLCHSVTVNLASAVMHFTWLNFMIQKPSSFNILALPIFNFFFILWFSTWYIWLLAVVWSILSSRCWFVCSQSIVNGINMQLKSHKFSQMYSPVSMMHVQRMHNTSYHIYILDFQCGYQILLGFFFPSFSNKLAKADEWWKWNQVKQNLWRIFFFFDARHEKLLMTDQVFLSLVGKQHRKRNWVISWPPPDSMFDLLIYQW